jgi:L-histidine N-alpha-methyltransferase
MNALDLACAQPLRCLRIPPSRAVPSLLDDVRSGLLHPPRSLPPKYFYDEAGSRLFDQICDTPEYYPTRTEDALLARHAADIIAQTHPAHLLELGSGSARKTRHLLNAVCARSGAGSYWPFDVCESMLMTTAQQLSGEYPALRVHPLLGDYQAGLDNLPQPVGGGLYLFLGSTLGNFRPGQAQRLLRELCAHMQPDDHLLLGLDRVKDRCVLHAAYNDAAGITAAFNRNVLRVLNREVGADFRPEAYEHLAEYVPEQEQIEMYLIPRRAQWVHVNALDVALELTAGERICTEISRKFTAGSIEQLLRESGLALTAHYEAPDAYYSLVLARPHR